ncbi:MAG: ABC transporter permease [Marinilabiliales bacterium]|nr:ABC transporter permease [Marinilabiliales bacterium]
MKNFATFLRIALRYLWRSRTYSLLNFVCLAFGISCSIGALLYLSNQLGHDRFHVNRDRLFQVDAYVAYFNGDQFPKEYLSAALAGKIVSEAPEIASVTRITGTDFSLVDGPRALETKAIYVDDSFFDLFTYPFLDGLLHRPHLESNTVLITRDLAQRWFGTTDCIGKSLLLQEGKMQHLMNVEGILKDQPQPATLRFDMVLPYRDFLAANPWSEEIGSTATETWILLRNRDDARRVESRIRDLIKNQESTLNQQLFLFPLNEKGIYGYANGHRIWKEMQRIFLVGSIGLAILLIACFNFINLAMAVNFKRFREAGIRKVAGAGKRTIVIQFLSETFLLVFISLLGALSLVHLFLPGFNTRFGTAIRLDWEDPLMVAFLVVVVLFTTLVSGMMPALFLASTRPVHTLKGTVVQTQNYSIFRQGLIVFQFVIPIVLLVWLLTIRVQDRYIANYDLGFDKEQMVIWELTDPIRAHAGGFKADLKSIPGIHSISFTNCIPSRGTRVTNDVGWEGKDASEKLHFWCVSTDGDYDKVTGLRIREGRFFNPAFPTDSACYLVNDVAALVMKLKKPIGSQITVEGRKGMILGTFSDFHALDLAGPYVPTLIRLDPLKANSLMIRLDPGVPYASINRQMQQVYAKYEPTGGVQPNLMSSLPDYSDLKTPSSLVGIASFLAILLACMGFYGLSSFTAESRTKEIGIRKVNGAGTASILGLLLRNYSKWVLIAFLIALPIAVALSLVFLGRFYFHAPLPLWVFVAAPLMAYLTAIATVMAHAWRTAVRNPADALRWE